MFPSKTNFPSRHFSGVRVTKWVDGSVTASEISKEKHAAIFFWKLKRNFSKTRKGRTACVFWDWKKHTSDVWPWRDRKRHNAILSCQSAADIKNPRKNSNCKKLELFILISLLFAETINIDTNSNVSNASCLITYGKGLGSGLEVVWWKLSCIWHLK